MKILLNRFYHHVGVNALVRGVPTSPIDEKGLTLYQVEKVENGSQ
jgi:hypothetical protein